MKKLHSLAPAAAAAVALLALGGCATKGDIEQLRSEIAGLRSSIELDRRQGHPGRGGRSARRCRCRRRRGFGCRCEPEGGPDLPRRPAQVGSADEVRVLVPVPRRAPAVDQRELKAGLDPPAVGPR